MYGRAFNRQEDIGKLQVFLADMRRQVGQAAYFQFGDLMWRMVYSPNGFDDSRDIRLWDGGDGGLDGFVFYLPPDNNPEFFLRPELYESRAADEMVRWAVKRGRAGGASAIETSCIDRDAAKAEFLQRNGFEPLDDVMVFMEREVTKPITQYPLPRGYSIVSGAEPSNVPSVTGRRIVTREAYERVRHAPGYRDDLGLRVCYQNRHIVSGCICWYDEVDNCGEFEPVGTHKEHRRKGLALAVMARTMENLRRYGADKVYVRTYKDNVPAVGLYQRMGFTITNEDFGWRRTL